MKRQGAVATSPARQELKWEASRPQGQIKQEYRRPVATEGRTQVNYRGDKRCYSCGRWGHLSYSCPNRKPVHGQPGQNTKALFAGACEDVAWNEDSHKFLKRGEVNGRPVQMHGMRPHHCVSPRGQEGGLGPR